MFWTDNPFFLKAFFKVFGLLIFTIFYFLRKPQEKWRIPLVVFGGCSFVVCVLIDTIPSLYLWVGPKLQFFLILFSIFMLLPLPELLKKYFIGRVLWPAFDLIVLFYLLFDPVFYFIYGKKIANFQGKRGKNLLVIQQSIVYSCVSSCIASVVTDFGHPLTEGEACVVLETSKRGTNFGRILYYFQNYLKDLGILQNSFSEVVNFKQEWVYLVPVWRNKKRSSHLIVVYPCPKNTRVQLRILDDSTEKNQITCLKRSYEISFSKT